MAISKKNKNSINLIDPVYTENDAFTKAYEWMVTIGKYLLIFVEMIVLGVFFSRFFLDKKRIDLNEEVESQIQLLRTEPWVSNNILFSRYQKLLKDVGTVKNGQQINSSVVSEIVSGIPITLTLKGFTLNESKVSMSFMASSLEEVKIYESALKENERYSDVSFSIQKEDAEISVGVSFNIVGKQD
ncbi:hypothetical protein KBB69_01315 [Candidatus Dojkabacteria bacterium]|jgi:hypothetical protein|uniref:PilN domain-containing protein n=1 Tax=Candidatus Dojkabacteria bacterium TaxID=2099670 RepID=A0A847CZ08_9BACT|nr:hypothetical protein [Candidatus Dojkabacteria bacterium]NLD25188.1 hypothetical protein [Candidatus Dojkabacteria bacterium]HRY74338.1 hypothetical protein [Candidatus Dojkabacteria bacterium]HRZ84531.1 hypothetical protein [Candidatus Dojkabacteria bacterium]